MHLADSLERFASLAAAQGQAERAVSLFAAADACYTAAIAQATLVSWARDPGRRTEHEQLLAQAQAQLGESAFAAAWAAGTTMDQDQAVKYALDTAPMIPPASCA